MQVGSLEPYEDALQHVGTIELVLDDGRTLDLDVSRWLADADEADLTAVARCTEPTLDIGCGPGRMVRALYARNVAALGVDIAKSAVALSNRRGGPALLRDVFEDLPAEGRWASILLLDGNVGIGGNVERLLARARDLLMTGGRLIVESSPWPIENGQLSVRFRHDGVVVGNRFPWAVLDLVALREAACSVGLAPVEQWSVGPRHFLALTR